MSIQTELTRLTNAKTAIKTAIEGKGITVPDGTLLDGMAALIEAIQAGGGGNLWGGKCTTGSFVLAEETTSKYVIATNTDDAMLGLLNEGERLSDSKVTNSIGLLVVKKPTTEFTSSSYANCVLASIYFPIYWGSGAKKSKMTNYLDAYGTSRAITTTNVGAYVEYDKLSMVFTSLYKGSPDFTYQWIAWRGVI